MSEQLSEIPFNQQLLGPRKCIACGTEFKVLAANHVYCKKECRPSLTGLGRIPSERECLECKKVFKPSTWMQYTCSRTCSNNRAKKRGRSATPRSPDVCSGTKGAIAELAVCVDLMSKGWHVYRAMSPHAPADILATKGKEVRQLEVRSGYHNLLGKLIYGTKVCGEEATEFAIYIHTTKEVHYVPIA